jgi:hypothetical protein
MSRISILLEAVVGTQSALCEVKLISPRAESAVAGRLHVVTCKIVLKVVSST